MPGASDPIATDFRVLKPCPACGRNLTGLPEDSRCPECGFDPDPAVMQARVEVWFATWDGLLLRNPPPHALVLLNTPLCRRTALARFLTCFIAPIALAFMVVTLFGCVEVTTTYARWWESPDQPGIRRELDHTHVSRTAFAPLESSPYLVAGERRGKRYASAMANRTIAMRIRIPDRNAYIPLALLLVVALAARIGAWVTLADLANCVRSGMSLRRRATSVWPAMAWFAPALWFALWFAVAATGALAAVDLLLVSSGLLALGLFSLAVLAFAVLSARKIVGAMGSVRRTDDALSSLVLWIVWTVGIVVLSVVAAIALYPVIN